jgi:hypothetical protein
MSGEKQGRREQIDRMTRHLVQNGGQSPEAAKAKATEAAIRADRRDEKKR